MMMIVMMMRSVEDFLWQKVISVGGGGGSGRCAQEVATACQGEDKRRKVNIDIDVIHLLNVLITCGSTGHGAAPGRIGCKSWFGGAEETPGCQVVVIVMIVTNTITRKSFVEFDQRVEKVKKVVGTLELSSRWYKEVPNIKVRRRVRMWGKGDLLKCDWLKVFVQAGR